MKFGKFNSKPPFVTVAYVGKGWNKEKDALRRADKGHADMAKKGYVIASTDVSAFKGTLRGWVNFSIVALYELKGTQA